MNSPDFAARASAARNFRPNATGRRLAGHTPTIALTPVVDGRTGAYEDNLAGTWKLVERVYDLLKDLCLPDGTPIRFVVPPEIVYGARTGALAQEYYTTEGVSANIWISRSWAYSDELMSAAMGIGSSEWQQAAYGLNQTDRPGAVWLKAFCAAMDEKERPIFQIYNPDLEGEEGDLTPFVAERLCRFARCAAAVAEIRGKNYLSVGSVSMGILGSDVRRNVLLRYFGMGSVSVDMVGVRGRIDSGLFDHEEFDRAFAWCKESLPFTFNENGPRTDDDLLAECIKMTLVVRDMMIGNPRLADSAVGAAQGFKADVEHAQGYNAIAAGTQGQRQWTDLYPNFDLTESILTTSFDWDGYREPFVVGTENDCKNAIGMLLAQIVSGVPQLFADIRTNWTPESIQASTGVDVSDVAPRGLIDKRNSGAASLDYSVDLLRVVDPDGDMSVQDAARALRADPELQQRFIAECCANTHYMAAILEYFPGDGLSSHFRTPGAVPMTAYRYNGVGDRLSVSIVEGETVDLPEEVAERISQVTNPTWPESYWAPYGMTSFEYMSRMGPNHDANSFGLIGADLITLNAMLRIPVDFHNIANDAIFRPTMWDRFGGDDFRACDYLGPLY
ncbi:MAG: L-fucose isomerase [Rhodothermales bacterium]|jgi:L-fucose isomerase